jgi:predicted  nucleic acid-binding Zn-ribbon protein
MTTAELVMLAYSDELKKWEARVRAIGAETTEVLSQIHKVEDALRQETTFGAFNKLKSKFTRSPEEKVLWQLKEELDVLEARRERLEQNKPNINIYELGSINNTLFYPRSQGLI